MTDIVERLRDWSHNRYSIGEDIRLMRDAADEIERLRGDNKELQEAWGVISRKFLAARSDALEEAAKVATSFLTGDPVNGVPLRNPMAHEIADAIRALKAASP